MVCTSHYVLGCRECQTKKSIVVILNDNVRRTERSCHLKVYSNTWNT